MAATTKKTKIKKHPGGRPATKYFPDLIIPKIIEVAKQLDADPEAYFEYGIEDCIAGLFNTTVGTLQTWRSRHPEFDEAIKIWQQARNRALLKLSRDEGRGRRLHPAVWIFTAKNLLGWRDRQEVESSGTQTIKVISAIPRPRPEADTAGASGQAQAEGAASLSLSEAREPEVVAESGEEEGQ